MKRERHEAVEQAEDQEELSGHLTLEVDRRQGYEDELKAQLRAAGVMPLSWQAFCARRGRA